MSLYILENYTNKEEGDPKLEKLNEDEVFKIIQKEGEEELTNRKKIAIYKYGECMIDWS